MFCSTGPPWQHEIPVRNVAKSQVLSKKYSFQVLRYPHHENNGCDVTKTVPQISRVGINFEGFDNRKNWAYNGLYLLFSVFVSFINQWQILVSLKLWKRVYTYGLVCSGTGFKPGAAGWKAQMKPRSYDGPHVWLLLVRQFRDKKFLDL